MIDWSRCPMVESVPDKLGGAWTLRGTRIPIEMLFVNLASGATVEDFLHWFEGITREQIVAVLEFAARIACPRPSPGAAPVCAGVRILFDHCTP